MDYAIDHLNKMVRDFEAEGYSTVWKVLKGHEQGVPQKRERIFIVSVRNDVLDDIGMPFMCLSNVFPDPEDHEPTVRDAIGDIENDPDREELIQSMKDSSKGHWIYGFETHPDFLGSGPCLGLKGINDHSKVISIGDNIVGPWFQEQIKNGIITLLQKSWQISFGNKVNTSSLFSRRYEIEVEIEFIECSVSASVKSKYLPVETR